MYSPSVIRAKLATAQAQIDRRPQGERFSLTMYSLRDSINITSQIEQKWHWEAKDKKLGNYVGLALIEKQFIENERIVCANNFLYWARRYAKVLWWDGYTLVRFVPFQAQKIIVNIWGELEEKGWAIVVMQLKARQLGMSTLTELAIAHRVQFLPNRNALVASSDPEKTREMAEMMDRAWDMQPHFMQAPSQSYEAGQRFRVFPKFTEHGDDVSSSVSLQHGNKLSGIARGKTPSDAHLSEIPDFNNPAEHIEASLFNAMHENPGMFVVMESTAKGKKGKGRWWYNTWEEAKRGWPVGESDICPIFLPYFMGTEIYPTKTWLKKTLEKRGITLKDWKPSKRTIAHALACARYVRERDYLRNVLGPNWRLPKEQMFWWEFKYEQAKKKDTLHKFLEEMPANDEEAFQNSGRPIFQPEFISELNDHKKPLAKYCPLTCHEPETCNHWAVFMLLGHDIREENEPLESEIDYSRDPIKIVADYAYGKYRHEYYLVPVFHDPLKWRNRIFIWEFPRFSPYYRGEANSSQPYATGIDCAYGLDTEKSDNTVLDIVRKGTYHKPAEQVAQIGSPNLPAIGFFPYAEALGTFYSYRTDEVFNTCKQVIEIQAGGGDLQYELKKIGWPVPSGFHEWKTYDDVGRAIVKKLGWETNYRNRDLLITKSAKAIKDWYFRINSPRTIKELGELQKGEETEKVEGEEHDDFVFAPFFAYFSLHVDELYEKRMGELGHTIKQGFPPVIDKEGKELTETERRQLLLDELNARGVIINLQNPFPESRDEEGLIYTRASDTNRY